MSKTNFLDKNNIATLWSVIADEDIFKNHAADIKNNILQIFSDNIKGFYNQESKNNNTSLVEINKKYILLILQFIKTNFPKPSINKITIHDEVIPIHDLHKEPITIEEIKKDRITQFDQDFNKLEQDFQNAFKLPIPEPQNFSDNVKDKPIQELERVVKEMAEQRNYEIEEINRNNVKPPSQLTPNEIQTQVNTNFNTNVQINNGNRLKHIKLENMNQILQQNAAVKKHIQWQDELDKIQEQQEMQEEEDIFSKLKPKKSVELINEERNRIQLLEENIKNMNSKMEEMNTQINKIFLLLQNKKE
jgi:hypothetical protein